MLGWSFRVRAAEDRGRNIAVLYPDIGEPYRSVFAAIIGGIEDQANGRVASFAVGATPVRKTWPVNCAAETSRP